MPPAFQPCPPAKASDAHIDAATRPAVAARIKRVIGRNRVSNMSILRVVRLCLSVLAKRGNREHRRPVNRRSIRLAFLNACRPVCHSIYCAERLESSQKVLGLPEGCNTMLLHCFLALFGMTCGTSVLSNQPDPGADQWSSNGPHRLCMCLCQMPTTGNSCV